MGNTLTEGLRALISLYCWGDKRDADLFKASADIIDEEHEKACAKAYGDGASSVPIAVDEWMLLPKDASGEPIHIGDVLMWSDGKTFTVNGIGDGTLFYYDDDGDSIEWTSTKYKRHYHAPTIEEVLDELLQRFAEDGYDGCTADLVAEYAAKLQLREES